MAPLSTGKRGDNEDMEALIRDG
ncbi:hypothetical protein E2C01_085327 [Portunus trituberculatus]|uniref:Uncharacterized protein n=1 Tax=Portunus trituberculatus TaxID=210409 RepID=A0A5B7JA61_PORTR|nr:hypothetical protein [Portunus trituberculatus]